MPNQDPSWIPWMTMARGLANNLGFGAGSLPAKADPSAPPPSGWYSPALGLPPPPSAVSQMADYTPQPFDTSNTLSMDQVPYQVGVDPNAARQATASYSPTPFQGGGNGPGKRPGLGGVGGQGSDAKGYGADYQAALDALKSQYGKMADAQRAAADPMRQNLQNLLGDHLQYDLTPLAALVDNWTGSHLAQSYKAPESVQQRRQEIQGLQQGISKAEMGANQSELQAAKDYASGQMDLAKFKNDSDYKNKMLQLEQEKVGLEREKVNAAAAKGAQGKTPQQWQYGAAGFGKRMLDAEQQFRQLMSNPGAAKDLTTNWSAIQQMLPSGTQSEPLRKYDQIKNNFISAVLRKESGATISPEEMKNEARKYFPQAGDTKAVLDMKELARKEAIQNMVETAGPAWNSTTPALSQGTGTPQISPEQARAELARRRGQK